MLINFIRRLFTNIIQYKPRITPMYKIAEALGWEPVVGVQVSSYCPVHMSNFIELDPPSQAMIEQGLSQQRMWVRSIPTAEVGSDPDVLKSASPKGADVDAAARIHTEEMNEVIVVAGKEVDRASGKAVAIVTSWKASHNV